MRWRQWHSGVKVWRAFSHRGAVHIATSTANPDISRHVAEGHAQHRQNPWPRSIPFYLLAPFGGASPEASASFARSGSPVIKANSGFIGGVRAALHVIDEGSYQTTTSCGASRPNRSRNPPAVIRF